MSDKVVEEEVYYLIDTTVPVNNSERVLPISGHNSRIGEAREKVERILGPKWGRDSFGIVYFLQADNIDYTKIGFTVNQGQRLQDLKYQYRLTKPRFTHTILTNNLRLCENQIHTFFWNKRVQNNSQETYWLGKEWFNLTDEDVDDFRDVGVVLYATSSFR